MPKGPELRPWDDAWLDKRVNIYALITPDVAARLLAVTNTGNRRIKRAKIADYVRDMAAGKWTPESASLKWSWDKVLLDGQNRLLAAVEADVPFGSLVQTGLDPESQSNMDSGAPRTVADVYRLHGLQADPNNVAAAASLRYRYDDMLATGNPVRIIARKPLTRAEALDFIDAHPHLGTMVPLARSLYDSAPGIARSVWLAGIATAAEVDETEARRFAADFMAGNPEPGIVALLRYAAQTMTPKQQSFGYKLKNPGVRHLSAFARAWNAWRKQEELSSIRIRDDDRAVAFI
jgi:predicted protein tyrosine phosphatase